MYSEECRNNAESDVASLVANTALTGSNFHLRTRIRMGFSDDRCCGIVKFRSYRRQCDLVVLDTPWCTTDGAS